MRPTVNEAEVSSGIVSVEWNEPLGGKRARVHINKDGAPEYHYVIRGPGVYRYPLQYGSGAYTLELFLEDAPGSGQYRRLERGEVAAEMPDPEAVFLQSCVNMPWSEGMECIKKAHFLKTAWRIYSFIGLGFSYDAELAANIKYDYTPDIERAYRTRRDICFGLTALCNSMLRSVGVRAKMIHGYANGIYHCWSEVLLGGEWRREDVTFDIARMRRGGGDAPVNYETKFIY